MTIIHPGLYCSMIEWCFMPLSTVFQLYHGNSSHYSCLSWVLPVLGCSSEVSCTGTFPRKNPDDPVRLKPRTPGLRVKHFATEPRRTPNPSRDKLEIGVWLLVDYFKNITIIFFVILLSKMTLFVL